MILNAFNRSLRVLTAWISPKVLLVMKLTTAMLILFLVQVSAKSYSQITLNEQNSSLEKVLNSIKKQTGYSFFYDAQDVKDASVTVQVANATLDQVLSICFHDLPIDFKVVQNNVVLKKKDETV